MATAIELTANDVQGLCLRYFKDNCAGDIDNTPEKNINVHIIGYKLKPISEEPSGFLGLHRYLTVEVSRKSTTSKEDFEKLRFFTKSAPLKIASRMEYLEQFGVFKKEISVYRDVLPKLQNNFLQVAPKCYYADNNLLVFEDLMQQGYKMAAGRDGILKLEHLKCALKTLAALHAASLVYEVKEKEKLSFRYSQAVVENAYPLNCSHKHVRYQNFLNAIKVFKEFIKLMPKYQTDLDFILNQLQTKMSVIFKLAQTSAKYQNVFSHGDLWANNIMFEFSIYDDIPRQSRFVDFQLARYAPPMLDLITILTIPTSREFRSQHLAELLADYYGFMMEFLERDQLCIDNFIPKEQFYASFEEFRICGLIEACLFSHLTILPANLTQTLTTSTEGFSDFFDSKRVEICLMAFRTDAIYRERLTDMLEDFVDNYVLRK